LNALEILNRGDVDLPKLRGSWAGAMGQVQFMPSSYLKYAEDFDGDGLRDIWSTPADIFASIANYLKGYGWDDAQPWGREVAVTREVERQITNDVDRRNGTCSARRDMTVSLPVAEWRTHGVQSLGNRPLPEKFPDASLVSGRSRHFLVLRNYDVLLDYNCAHAYAITVALLADRLAAKPATGAGSAAPKSKARSGRTK
jgi:membrane-bound lytic murein transglycosylase B